MSRRPDDAALQRRARAMLVAMTERERWIYALPRAAFGPVCAQIEAAGFARAELADDGRVVRFGHGEPSFVVMVSEALDAVLLEGATGAAVPLMKTLLDAHGFVPQSALWAQALDLGQPKAASRALLALAHMMCAWDDDFADLFLLHLASPDPVARHEAAMAVTLAAMVARDAGPALLLLDEALQREKFPKLKETLQEAMRVLREQSGTARAVGPQPKP